MRVKFVILAGAAILPATVFSAPLAAQSITLGPPQIRQPLDGNGIDLSSGAVAVPSSAITIGGSDGLTHRRYWVGNGWRHNYILSITHATAAQGEIYYVQIGGVSHAFLLDQGVFTGVDGEMGTLAEGTGDFTYVDARGTTYTFDKSPVANGEGYYEAVEAVGTQIVAPSGRTTTLSYRGDSYTLSGNTIYTVRLQSVTVNTGYQLKFSYAANTPSSSDVGDSWYRISQVTAINNAVEYCDPTADSCSLTEDWPYLAYSETTSGSDTLESVTDILGRVARFRTDPSLRLTGIKRPGETSDGVAIAYDTNSRVSSITRQGSYQRTYSWSTDTNGDLVSVSDDALGRERTVTADPDLHVILSDEDALGNVTSYTYDSEGRVTQVTAPEGNKVAFTRDDRGRVTEVRRISKTPNTPADIVTSATYPALTSGTTVCANAVTCDLPLTTTDALGNVTNYTYDSTHGGITKVELPSADGTSPRPTTEATYAARYATVKNSSGTLVQESTAVTRPVEVTRCRTAATCAGTANEQAVTFAYPGAGVASNIQPLTITRAAGDGSITETTTFAYTIRGETQLVDGPLSGSDDVTTYRYDDAGQRIGTILADPEAGGTAHRPAARLTYNDDGQVTVKEVGRVGGTTDTDWAGFYTAQKFVTTYDAFGRTATVAQVDPSSTAQFSLTQYSYDYAGRLDCTAVRMNAPATTTTLPASACTTMTATSGADDRITRTYYDLADHVSEVWSGVGTGLEQQTAQATYSDNGTVTWVEDANDNRTRYWYDGFDRLWRINYPDPTTTHTHSNTDYDKVTYDAAGQVLTHRTREGKTFTYAYDDLGRVTSKDVPVRSGLATTYTRDVYYAYDLYGDLTSALFDSTSGEGLSFTYDALGRLTSTTNDMDSTTRTLSYQYDVANRETRLTYPDSAYFDYTYDRLDRMLRIYNSTGVTMVRNLYDNEGWLANVIRDSSAPDDALTYDTARRLSQVFTDNTSSAWDVTRTYSYDQANGVTEETVDNQSFIWNPQPITDVAYTANGLNQLTAAGANTLTYDANGNLASDGATSFTYDTENRLVSASGQNNGSLRYDPFGRLYELTDGNGNVTRFLYDGDALVAEYDGSGTLLKRYVHGMAAGDNPLVEFDGTGTGRPDATYLYADRTGSIVYATDYTGAAKQVNAYDEYGLPGASSGIGNIGRFRFTGQIWLPEIGVYYYKARMYSPGLGRFLQTDPIGYAAGLNIYAYVGNDPMNFVDYLGLDEGTEPDGDGNCPSGKEKGDDGLCYTSVSDGTRGTGSTGFGGFIGGGTSGGMGAGNFIDVNGWRLVPEDDMPIPHANDVIVVIARTWAPILANARDEVHQFFGRLWCSLPPIGAGGTGSFAGPVGGTGAAGVAIDPPTGDIYAFTEVGGQVGGEAGAGPAIFINAPTESSGIDTRFNGGAILNVSVGSSELGPPEVSGTISPEVGATISVTQIQAHKIGSIGPGC